MTFGYTGRILKVDLTNRKIEIEERDDAFYRRYLGGRALVAYYLLQEMPPAVNPLGPDNMLVFAPGVLTGAPVSGTGRNSVGARSPLTGAIGSSEAGGFWGAELKRAGYDAIVLRGKASSPVYLWVQPAQVELRDATQLWGTTTGECEKALWEELGDRKVRTALIGPAGESMVRYAAVANDRSHFAGRGGLGAVMGSKRLKGIAVRASSGPGGMQIANPAGVREISRWLGSHMELGSSLHDVGTPGQVMRLSTAGGLPTRNFRAGHFDGDGKINGHVMRDTILVDRGTCAGCVIRCKRIVQVGEPYYVDPGYGGPEYESVAALGSCVGVDDLMVVAKANERCAAYGLDTISTGVSIAFAMECFERGLLSSSDTGGLALRWGDGQLVLRLVDQIAHRDGFGSFLAEGVARMAAQIGQGSEEFALHVKGQELPMHEPRIKHMLGVGFGLSPTGADHQHNMHDTMVQGEGPALDKLRIYNPELRPVETTLLNEDKTQLYFHFVNQAHFWDCAIMCHFMPYDPEQMVKLLNAVTGWDVGVAETQEMGQRAITLSRIFNLREGFTAAYDRLPDRFYAPFQEGEMRTARSLDKSASEWVRRRYYELMGWEAETGIPTCEALERLDIGWAAAHLVR